MVKSELIGILAKENPELRLQDITNVVDAIFNEITETLASGNRVEIRGFGVFQAKERGARKGRNPRTGEAVDVEPKRVAAFKTGKNLHERLNAQLKE